MMLHVLLATALSASPALPTDSVHNASKSATERRDTTISAPRDTTVAAKQAPPPSPAGSNVSSTAGGSTTAPTAAAPSTSAPAAPSSASTTPAAAPPSSNATTSGAWTTTLLKSSTVVVSTSPATPGSATPSPSTPAQTAPSQAPAAQTTPAQSTPTSTVPTSVVAARPEHGVVQQSAAVVPAPDKTGSALAAAGSAIASASAVAHAEPTTAAAPRVTAPADASAVAPRPADKSTRVDARTVVSVRSSERIEPLYGVPLPSARVRLGAPSIADSIVVYKRERRLTLFFRGVPVKSYFVALGLNPVGDKQRAGDGRTPEGLFHVNAHNPASKYHLALRISYPDDAHRARAAAIGADPGGDIMIHGLPPEYSEAGKDHVANDWTNGCVALSNAEIEELWRAVPDGTPVQIKP